LPLTVETDGVLYETDLGTGEWKAVGRADFKNTRWLLAQGDRLYGIETGGSLYRINPGDGSRERVGREGAFKDSAVAAVLGERLYVIDKGGALLEVQPTTGDARQLGKGEFTNTRYLFGVDGKLSAIDVSGSMYRVSVK